MQLENTTAAIGKGFAIGSAALTALALFAAFMTTAGLNSINIANPLVMAGLFLGGMLPFLFSSLAMQAVGKAGDGYDPGSAQTVQLHPGAEGSPRCDEAQ